MVSRFHYIWSWFTFILSLCFLFPLLADTFHILPFGPLHSYCCFYPAVLNPNSVFPSVLLNPNSVFPSVLLKVVSQRFPQNSIGAVGSAMFLRFVNPAIVSPYEAGILDKKPLPRIERGLKLMSKVCHIGTIILAEEWYWCFCCCIDWNQWLFSV